MNTLLFTNINNKCIAAVTGQGRLIDYAENSNSPIGNIYKARVERQLTEIGALFANVGAKQQVFVNCDDIPGDVKITDGCNLLLQLTRAANEKKAATATGKIKIAGKFLIYMPLARVSGISKKISDSAERQRLIGFLQSYPNEKFVIRTAATAASIDQLNEEADVLINRWKQIANRYQVESQPRLLFREFDFVLQYVRENILRYSIAEIITDDNTIAIQIREYLAQTDYACSLKYVEPGGSVLAQYNLVEQIDRLSCRELLLENGVRITIDNCEALTAIDVNSGSFISQNNSNTAIVEINISAAREIMLQIRLRNLSGIIVIDFLKTDTSGREQVEKTLQECAILDASKIEVLGFTRTGLFEVLRKSRSFDILVDRNNPRS
ncbi:MAG: ribonuclease E/G [Bacillota bacterium]